MNFKVVVRKETKVNDIRYCEQFNESNAFLLKYFNFSCHMCERLTSHIFTPMSCGECKRLFHTRMEARGICYDCCTQIQGLLSEKHEELSSCPLCAMVLEQGEIYTVNEPFGHIKQVLLTTCKERVRKLMDQIGQLNGETILL